MQGVVTVAAYVGAYCIRPYLRLGPIAAVVARMIYNSRPLRTPDDGDDGYPGLRFAYPGLYASPAARPHMLRMSPPSLWAYAIRHYRFTRPNARVYTTKNSRKSLIYKSFLSSYPERDLNPHSCNSQGILSPSCLPIPPSGRPRLLCPAGKMCANGL